MSMIVHWKDYLNEFNKANIVWSIAIMKKSKQILFKLSDNLFDYLTDYCIKNNITKSKFLRDSIKYFSNTNNQDKIFYRDEQFKRNLMYEIRRYGNNLNQIAYKLNLALMTDDLSCTDKMDIQQAIKEHRELCSKIRELRQLVAKRL